MICSKLQLLIWLYQTQPIQHLQLQKFNLFQTRRHLLLIVSMEFQELLKLRWSQLIYRILFLIRLKLGKLDKRFQKNLLIRLFFLITKNKYKNTVFDVFSLIKIGILFKIRDLRIFFSSSIVYSILFSGAISTLVKTTKKGIFKKRQRPICSLVIFWIPIFAPITTHPKSLRL